MVSRKDIMFFSANSTVNLILAYLIFFPLPFLCFLFSIQYLNAWNRLVRISFFYRLVTAQRPTVTGVASFWFLSEGKKWAVIYALLRYKN